MSTPTANTKPIWAAKGDISVNNGTTMRAAITAAANDYTGAGANNALIHTASSDGSCLSGIKFTPTGSNVVTVARIFVNNGSDPTVAANNTYLGEQSLPVTSTDATVAQLSPIYSFTEGALVLPAGFRIYVGLGTAVSGGWVPSVVRGGQL